MLARTPNINRAGLLLGTVAAITFRVCGQSPGVAAYDRSPPDVGRAEIINAAAALQKSGKSLNVSMVREQLQRGACRLTLPKPNVTKLTPREVLERAQASHVRLGWYYQCTKCEDWHVNLAGGYFITSNGAVATAYHVVEPPRALRDGCLVAVAENDKAFAVKEVLAAERYADTCIIRLEGNGFKPLPLNTNVAPGDVVYCLSDPRGRRGYFSQGILNRFFALPERRRVNVAGAPGFSPTRIHVSADWAEGSSGSAVLDECGNAIGHVLAVTPAIEGEQTAGLASDASGTAGVLFHEAASARDVLALIVANDSGR